VHLNQHRAPTYPCIMCTKSFARRDVRERHVKESHGNRDSTHVACCRCGKVVAGRYLSAHEKTEQCVTEAAARVLAALAYPSSYNAGLIPYIDPCLMMVNLDLASIGYPIKPSYRIRCFKPCRSREDLSPVDLLAMLVAAYRTLWFACQQNRLREPSFEHGVIVGAAIHML